MEVILLKEVEHLGKPGDVVSVRDGYARNYLLPRKLATPATPKALRQVEQMRRARERREEQRRVEAEELASRLQGLELTVVAPAGAQGRLYGSVTAQQIADLLREQHGIEVDRRRIHLEAPIRTVGEHQVDLHVHEQVHVALKVRVLAESSKEGTPPEEAK